MIEKYQKEMMMTLSHISNRFAALIGAVSLSFLMIFVAPMAHAAGPQSNYYEAGLAAQPLVNSDLVRGVIVKCEGTNCRAPITSSAAKNMCVSIAREFGEVTSFKAGKRSFDAAEIEKCNGKNMANVAKK
jgi:hypothetical protein